MFMNQRILFLAQSDLLMNRYINFQFNSSCRTSQLFLSLDSVVRHDLDTRQRSVKSLSCIEDIVNVG